MRNGFLASLTAMLAVTSLAIAQPLPNTDRPGTFDQAAPSPLPPPRVVGDLGIPAPGPTRSPYWPNPLGKFECAPPPVPPSREEGGACGLPGDDYHNRGELVWANIDYLLWWVKKGPESAPLVTTSSAANLGVLGRGDTSVLFGGSGIDYKSFSGLRFDGGFWFGRGSDWGVDAGGFFLERRPERFFATSSATGTPLLARPVIDVLTGQESALLISDPNIVRGAIAVTSSSTFSGADINLVENLYHDNCSKLIVLGGFRYVHLDEDLNIFQSSVLLPGGVAGFAGGAVAVPSTLSLFDRFATENDFYGAQLGARYEYLTNSVFVNVLGKVALGDSREGVSVGGNTSSVLTTGTATHVGGGLLALSSNGGRQTRDEFAVVPEINFNLGYQFTPLFRAYIGYSFLYWSDVVRPGDQINRAINPTLVPTSQAFGTVPNPALPGAPFQRTDFWAQGLNFGVEFRY